MADDREAPEIHVERAAAPPTDAPHPDGREAAARAPGLAPEMKVREEDLEPHAGLRYIARWFKILAILLILLLIGEVALGLATQGSEAIPTLLVEATRLIVFAGLLWGAADLGIMLIESNHDLRATRILVGRLNYKLQKLVELEEEEAFASEPLRPVRERDPPVAPPEQPTTL